METWRDQLDSGDARSCASSVDPARRVQFPECGSEGWAGRFTDASRTPGVAVTLPGSARDRHRLSRRPESLRRRRRATCGERPDAAARLRRRNQVLPPARLDRGPARGWRGAARRGTRNRGRRHGNVEEAGFAGQEKRPLGVRRRVRRGGAPR